MTGQQRFRMAVAVVVACSLLPLATRCSIRASHRPIRPATAPARPAHEGNAQADAAMLLQVMPAPYQLPTALSREVVLPGADGLLILGGRMFVLGGGTASSVPTVQAFTQGTQTAVVGQLGRARSDSGGVSAGPVGYVVGGYDGTILDPQVLATTDGRHFRVAARLPVPVRYAATAAVSGLIWVFGGTPGGT